MLPVLRTAFRSAAPLLRRTVAPATASRFVNTFPLEKLEKGWHEEGDKDALGAATYLLPHAVYTKEETEAVEVTHRPIKTPSDAFAKGVIKTLRGLSDVLMVGPPKVEQYLYRLIFLETVAGVPGVVGGLIRQMRSLGRMKKDYGWIHTLLEEAENERMHLMTFMEMHKVGIPFRSAIFLTQGLFVAFYGTLYTLAPRTSHRLVAYLEEEAVKTYTQILDYIDDGTFKEWQTLPATQIAKDYWELADDATFRDVIAAVRYDEVIHREVNHKFADMKAGDPNPYH